MSSAPRYDAVVVGGGLAGIATATWLAKRGRRVALVDPRPEFGGAFADQRLGSVTVSLGPRAVAGHERLGWADAYFEAIGLSLSLLTREGTTFKRQPLQLIWGPRRLSLGPQRPDVVEELRREYRVAEPDAMALLADLDAVYEALAIRMDPSPAAEKGTSLARLRTLAAARAFSARFGALAPAEYVRARGLAPEFAAYLESWRSALMGEGDAAGTWLFRTALVHRGVVSLPGGRAAVCRLLASKFQSLGGELFRSPVTAIGAGREPFVETDGRRLHARAVVINAHWAPGEPKPYEPAVGVTTAAYTLPVTCVPEAMGPYLLVADGAGLWSLADRRHDAGGALAQDLLVAAYRESAEERERGGLRVRLEALLPFAAGQLGFVGSVRDDELPDSMDAKLCEALPWRARANGLRQVARSAVWWVPDHGAPWLGDAQEYRAALTLDRVLQTA